MDGADGAQVLTQGLAQEEYRIRQRAAKPGKHWFGRVLGVGSEPWASFCRAKADDRLTTIG
jgi:hypothetical protein